VALGLFNVDASIRGFARACFNYGLQRRFPVYFSHKATVLKQYDGRFIDIFAEEFAAFAPAFAEAGLDYAPRLIDDMVAFSLKADGGYLWACKNYDGDVQADYMAQGYGSPGLMTSVLMSPDGRLVETETAHGTVRRHFDRYRDGKPALANPLATIHAWSRALWHRARLDGTPEVARFAEALEQAAADVVDEGVLTPDLAPLAATRREPVDTETFIAAVAARLERAVG
jgi:isocitrate dehydrogenase